MLISGQGFVHNLIQHILTEHPPTLYTCRYNGGADRHSPVPIEHKVQWGSLARVITRGHPSEMTPWEQVVGTPGASNARWDSWEASQVKRTERYTLWILPKDTFLLP